MDERTLADNLDRYLDKLATGHGGDSTPLDPDLARVARRYRVIGRRPAPAEVRNRVWQRVEGQESETGRSPVGKSFSSNGNHAIVHRETPPGYSVELAYQRGLARLAIAALLVLGGFGLYYVLSGAGLSGDPELTTVPAVVASASPPGKDPLTEASLVTVTLPEGTFPAGDNVGVGFGQYTVPAGVSTTRTVITDECCAEMRFIYVLEGIFTVHSGGSVQILRADGNGTWEATQPGAEIVLGPGDALLTGTESRAEGANLGSTPVELLYAVLFPDSTGQGTDPGELVSATWIVHDRWEGRFRVPAGPITLQLLRVELSSDAWFLLAQDALYQSWLGYTEQSAGTPEAVRVGWASGGAFNAGEETAILYVLTLTT